MKRKKENKHWKFFKINNFTRCGRVVSKKHFEQTTTWMQFVFSNPMINLLCEGWTISSNFHGIGINMGRNLGLSTSQCVRFTSCESQCESACLIRTTHLPTHINIVHILNQRVTFPLEECQCLMDFNKKTISTNLTTYKKEILKDFEITIYFLNKQFFI